MQRISLRFWDTFSGGLFLDGTSSVFHQEQRYISHPAQVGTASALQWSAKFQGLHKLATLGGEVGRR